MIKIIQTLGLDRCNVFLFDGFGALMTAVLPLTILALFGDIFKMPLHLLFLLSGIASLYAIYSLSCYFFNPKAWKTFLRIIILANILYCLLTLGSVLYFSSAMTKLGVAYFLIEISIVLIVVGIEQKILWQNQDNGS